MNSFHLPSLRQAMIWLFIIMVACFGIGGIIAFFDTPPSDNGNKTTGAVTIPGDGIDKARVNLVVDSGSLTMISEPGDDLLSGEVLISSQTRPPVLTHSLSNGTANVAIQHPSEFVQEFIGGEEQWNLSLKPEIPTSLLISLGSGDINLTPGKANLSELAIENGAGSVNLDLREWTGSELPVRIDNGVGEITVTFPEHAQVTVSLERAIGNLFLNGFSGSNDQYYHTSSLPDAPVIDVSISQGLGDLTLNVQE